MTRIISYLLAAIISATGCISRIDPTGYTAIQDIPTERGYKSLYVRDGLEVRMSNIASAYLEGDAAAIPYVETDCDGERFNVGLRKNTKLGKNCSVIVHIPGNISLTSINTSGNSCFGTEGYYSFPNNATFTVEGDSRIDANVKIGEIHINASNNAVLTLSGNATLAYLNLKGNARLGSDNDPDYPLSILSVYTTMSDSSCAYFSCNGTIAGELSGNSTIRYKGSAEVKAVTSGGSSVIKQE